MKNKFLLCACLIAMGAAVLTSCKKQEDLSVIDAQIANKTLLGTYIFIDVDSAAMNSTLHEWNLAIDDNGQRVGYYGVAATGNGLDRDESTPLTWSEATMTDMGLAMSVPVKVGSEEKVLKWHDGVLSTADYTTEKSLISLASTLRSVHDNFKGLDFVHNDTSSYITTRMDTALYLAWKSEVVYFTQEQIDEYKQFLLENADTLAWFNETYPMRAVPDTVRFSTKQQADGTYKGQIPSAYEDKEITQIKTNHGPLHIINGEMVFGREDKTNTASFVFHEQTWTEQFYTKPGSESASYIDYMVEITDATWTPISFINVKKFNILLKGKTKITYFESIAGKEKSEVLVDDKEYFYEIPLSGFSRLDGEVTYNELKYKQK